MEGLGSDNCIYGEKIIQKNLRNILSLSNWGYKIRSFLMEIVSENHIFCIDPRATFIGGHTVLNFDNRAGDNEELLEKIRSEQKLYRTRITYGSGE